MGADPEVTLGATLAADLARADGAASAGFLAGSSYARVARAPVGHSWSVALVGGDASARASLLEAAAVHVAANGGGRLVWWAAGATDLDDKAAAAAGFAAAREQHQLRVRLPIAGDAHFPAQVHVRTFEATHDVDAWLAVNNAAFEGHAEQGGWTRATLAGRLAEPWFDPALFLIAEDANGIAGFNWLKIHEHEPDRPGEIYAIGVAPGRQGQGLGRALAIEGLHRLSRRQITVGMLYVAADNTAALSLYRSLGFITHRTDRAYEREVAS